MPANEDDLDLVSSLDMNASVSVPWDEEDQLLSLLDRPPESASASVNKTSASSLSFTVSSLLFICCACALSFVAGWLTGKGEYIDITISSITSKQIMNIHDKATTLSTSGSTNISISSNNIDPSSSTTNITATIISNDTESSASSSPSPWRSLPSLTLLCRTYSGLMMNEIIPLVWNLDLFWPREYDQSSITFVLDAESAADHMLGTILSQNSFNSRPDRIHVRYEQKPGPGILVDIWRGYGYARQQYSNFYCDQYTEAEYVGIIDSDSWMIRPPITEDLFVASNESLRGYKAVLVGYNAISTWCPGATFLLGLPCLGEFMIHFPIIVKTSHFPLMRQYISRYRNVSSFEEAWQQMLLVHGNDAYSQFNIIASYLWHHHHSEYAWRINSCGPSCGHPTRSQLLHHDNNTDPMTSAVLAANIPIAQVFKHGIPLNNDYITYLFKFICLSSNYQAGECQEQQQHDTGGIFNNLPAVIYHNYYTGPPFLFSTVDGGERPWYSLTDPNVQENGQKLVDQTFALHQHRWRHYNVAQVTFTPYQISYDWQKHKFTPP